MFTCFGVRYFLRHCSLRKTLALRLIIFLLTFLCLWMLLACADDFILFINYFLTFSSFGVQLSIFLFIFFYSFVFPSTFHTYNPFALFFNRFPFLNCNNVKLWRLHYAHMCVCVCVCVYVFYLNFWTTSSICTKLDVKVISKENTLAPQIKFPSPGILARWLTNEYIRQERH